MNRNAWRAALTTVSLAAIATTGWSLYAVARYYDAPTGIAGAAVAVFDGAAYACLHLASEASEAGRSAVGARLAALTLTATSVYLNHFHAGLINGGLAAALLFSVPTLALLAVSELSWAGPRAAARTARGEHPYRLPAFGGWAWMLAPLRAGRTVKDRAVHHIEHAGRTVSGQPGKDRSATAVLGRRFAEMDPAEVIRIAHESQPELTPAELASLLSVYGVHVDAVQVALILHGRPAEYTVDRVRTAPDTEVEEPWQSDPEIALIRADMLSGQRPDNISEAVRTMLQKGLKDRAAAVAITREVLGPDTSPDSVRRTFDREIKKPVKPTGEVGQGGGGYN